MSIIAKKRDAHDPYTIIPKFGVLLRNHFKFRNARHQNPNMYEHVLGSPSRDCRDGFMKADNLITPKDRTPGI